MSEETKSNAQDRLDGMGASTETTGHGPSIPGEVTNQQLGGYKATLASKSSMPFPWPLPIFYSDDGVSNEAKGHARDVLQSADNGDIGILETGNDKNLNNVLGGHKATLKSTFDPLPLSQCRWPMSQILMYPKRRRTMLGIFFASTGRNMIKPATNCFMYNSK